MALRFLADILLPPHESEGGFDHAAVDHATRRLFLAHTANDALELIDLDTYRHLSSISGLTGVAGVLASDPQGLVFTSSRGEDTGGILSGAAIWLRDAEVATSSIGSCLRAWQSDIRH